jgi:putative NADH-flavin reductase
VKIAVIGATGFVGSAILQEALQRGHEVTAIVRNPDKLTPHENLHPKQGDVYNEDEVIRLVMGHDAVISAFNPGWNNPDIYNQQVKGARSIINGVDLPGFPPEYKQGALATREALNLLRKEPSLDWSFLSPSADLFPGQRTGKFRLGTDQLLADSQGKCRISIEDYAMAMIDEVEKPKHIRQRFTVGY